MAAKKTAKKVAKKPVAKKATKKVAAKKAAPKKVAKKVAKKTAKKAVKKTTKKVVKKTSKKAAPKKAAKKVAKKAAKKAVKKAAKKVAKKATKKVAKKVAKKVTKKSAKPASKKAAPAKAVKPAIKKTSSAAPSKSGTGKSQPTNPKLQGTGGKSPEKGGKPQEHIEDSAVITKPRSRKAILSPDEIPDPIPLAHQASMDLGKVFSQKDTRPMEKTRVQEDESMWVAAELKAMRKRFEEELALRRSSLENSQKVLDDLISLSDDGAGSETADTGNATLEREMQISKVDAAAAHVEEVVQALSRLTHKTYGLCLDCGKQIGKLRLQEAYPYATLCITCKEASDRAEALKL